MVRGLAALYAGTFLSGAWAIIIPTIPVLAPWFGGYLANTFNPGVPFLFYAPFWRCQRPFWRW